LVFEPGLQFLLMLDDEYGPVVAEVGAHRGSRRLSLRPGRYFVRGRASDYLVEGVLTVRSGAERRVAEDDLRRVENAELVRKGAHAVDAAHSLELGANIRSRLPNASGLCSGGRLGYQLDLHQVSFGARLAACTSGFENTALEARTNEYSLGVWAQYIWDIERLSLGAGVGAGASLTHQTFESTAQIPSRTSVVPGGFVLATSRYRLTRRLFVSADINVELHLMRFQETVRDDPHLEAQPALRGALGGGMYF
jgi:hypothetical protein